MSSSLLASFVFGQWMNGRKDRHTREVWRVAWTRVFIYFDPRSVKGYTISCDQIMVAIRPSKSLWVQGYIYACMHTDPVVVIPIVGYVDQPLALSAIHLSSRQTTRGTDKKERY